MNLRIFGKRYHHVRICLQTIKKLLIFLPCTKAQLCLKIFFALRKFFDELLNKLLYFFTVRFFLIHEVIDLVAYIVPDNLKGFIKIHLSLTFI
jgi:hypothetical protein